MNHQSGTPDLGETGAGLIVLKVGTSTLIDDNLPTRGFCLANIGNLVDCIVKLRSLNYRVVLITSGGVAAGCLRLKTQTRPTTIVRKQAASAVGQSLLMRMYDDLFAIREQCVAQLLITRTDLCRKESFVNFKKTLVELLDMSVIPIINENDSVASEQLRFGDNDTLAAYVAIALRAQWLILLTDVDFLYTANPKTDPTAKRIVYCSGLSDVYKIVCGSNQNLGSVWGTGGMRTKVVAAKVATAIGITTALCNGQFPQRILNMLRHFSHLEDHSIAESFDGCVASDELTLAGDDSKLPYVGTVIASQELLQTVPDQRCWILVLPVRGKLLIDRGAAEGVISRNGSLFASGIRDVEGEFYRGEAVSLYLCSSEESPTSKSASKFNFDGLSDQEAKTPELARCLVNFSSEDIVRIKGLKSSKFEEVLRSELQAPEVAHRSNIVFLHSVN